MLEYLENVGQVSEVEYIMKFDGSGKEHLRYFVMQSK
jgi:hypothetical protein